MQALPDVLLPVAPWALAGFAMIPVGLERAVIGRGYFSGARVKIGADAERMHLRVANPFQGIGSFRWLVQTSGGRLPIEEPAARAARASAGTSGRR